MEAITKPSVLNPLLLRNTVGAELVDILEARGIQNYEQLLGIANLRSKEKLGKTIFKKLRDIIADYEDVIAYLERFQENYLTEKPRYQANYMVAKKNFTRLKNAIPMMRGEFCDGYDMLDDIIDFFGAENEEEIFAASEKQAALFRIQNNVTVNPINLHAWLRRGELDFYAIQLPEYNESLLKSWIEGREWAKNVESADYFKSLPELFRQFGVALMLVPYLENTVYGAVRWIDGRPLIQISDRNRDLATCWFTLFHELGHVILHKDQEIYEGAINNGKSTNVEKQANKFANHYLFNGDSLRKAVFDRRKEATPMTAKGLAEEFGVYPIFSAYWLRNAQYCPTLQPRIPIDFIEAYQ